MRRPVSTQDNHTPLFSLTGRPDIPGISGRHRLELDSQVTLSEPITLYPKHC